MAPAGTWLEIAGQLRDVEAAWRDAARRRRVARDHGDTVTAARCEEALEAAFDQAADLRARLADMSLDRTHARVGQSGT